jgi:hypothetical protein
VNFFNPETIYTLLELSRIHPDMVNLKSVAIAATCWYANRIDVFRVGFNSDLQRETLIPLLHSPFPYLLMTPRATYTSSTHLLHLTNTNPTTDLWYDGSFSAWESLGGILTSVPAVTSWAPDRLDIVATGQTGPLTTSGGTAPTGAAGKTKAESSPVSYLLPLGARIVSISSVEEQTMLVITSGGMDRLGAGMRILVGFLLVLLLLLIGAMIACKHELSSCTCNLLDLGMSTY